MRSDWDDGWQRAKRSNGPRVKGFDAAELQLMRDLLTRAIPMDDRVASVHRSALKKIDQRLERR